MEANGVTVSVTITGKTYAEVVRQAGTLAGTMGQEITGTVEEMTPAKRGRKPKNAPVEDTETMDMADDSDADDLAAEPANTPSYDEMSFDDEEVEEEKPKAKTKKAVKFTEKDVNEACKAHAKEHGKAATLKILNGKFKVKSILELKPEQYAQVIAAME